MRGAALLEIYLVKIEDSRYPRWTILNFASPSEARF